MCQSPTGAPPPLPQDQFDEPDVAHTDGRPNVLRFRAHGIDAFVCVDIAVKMSLQASQVGYAMQKLPYGAR